MTRDEIIDRMGWHEQTANALMPDVVDRIERIVRAAERVEREACASVCDEYAQAQHAAIAIRERVKA